MPARGGPGSLYKSDPRDPVAAADPFHDLDDEFFRTGEREDSAAASVRPVTLEDEWRDADPRRDADIAARRARFTRWVTQGVATLGVVSAVVFLHAALTSGAPPEVPRVTAVNPPTA